MLNVTVSITTRLESIVGNIQLHKVCSIKCPSVIISYFIVLSRAVTESVQQTVGVVDENHTSIQSDTGGVTESPHVPLPLGMLVC